MRGRRKSREGASVGQSVLKFKVTKARTGQPPESRRKRIVGLGLPVVLVLGLGVGTWYLAISTMTGFETCDNTVTGVHTRSASTVTGIVAGGATSIGSFASWAMMARCTVPSPVLMGLSIAIAVHLALSVTPLTCDDVAKQAGHTPGLPRGYSLGKRRPERIEMTGRKLAHWVSWASGVRVSWGVHERVLQPDRGGGPAGAGRSGAGAADGQHDRYPSVDLRHFRLPSSSCGVGSINP